MKRKMIRIRLIGFKPVLGRTVRLLHRLGCVQIEDLATSGAAAVRPLQMTPDTVQRQEEISHLLTRLDSLLSTLQGAPRLPAPPEAEVEKRMREEIPLEQMREALADVGERVRRLVEEREALLEEEASLPRYEQTLRRLMPIVPPSAHAEGAISTVALVNRSHQWALDAVAARVEEVAGARAEMVEENVGNEMRAMLIVMPRDLAPELEKALGRESISRLRLPDSFAGQPPDVAVTSLRQRLAAIPEQLAAVDRRLHEIGTSWGARLRLWRARLREEVQELEILERFGETEYTFVLEGWLPADDETALRDALQREVGDLVAVERLPLTPEMEAQAPVELVNPTPVRPFESLIRIFSLPHYNDVDPSPLIALFLPLFFGMILGDVVYGLLLLLITLLARRRFREPGVARDLIHVLLLGSLWSIVFGFLYGEALGTVGEEVFGLHALWLERASPEAVRALLLFTIGVGAAHIVLGLLLGVWDALRQRSRSHLMERAGMLLGLVALFVVVAVLAERLPAGVMTPAVAVLVVGIVLLSASHGWLGLLLGPIEFLGLLGNVLSYLRIAAVGLASVYVAVVANQLAGSLGNLIIGVIVAVLIHALNLALGAFSPSIHSLRLHYVEFFRKFYEGGGRPFEPFRIEPRTGRSPR